MWKKSTLALFTLLTVSNFAWSANISPLAENTDLVYEATLLSSKLPSPRAFSNALYDGENTIYVTGGLNSYSNRAETVTEILAFHVDMDHIEQLVDIKDHFPNVTTLAGCAYIESNSAIYCFEGGVQEEDKDLGIYKILLDPTADPVVEKLGDYVEHGGVENMNVVSDGNENIWISSETGFIYHFNTTSELSRMTLNRFPTFESDQTFQRSSRLWFKNDIYSFTQRNVSKYTPEDNKSAVKLETSENFPDMTDASVFSDDNSIHVIHRPSTNTPAVLSRFEEVTGAEGDLTYQTIDELRIESFGNGVLLGSGTVFVPKLNRTYVFGGYDFDSYISETPVISDEIYYINRFPSVHDNSNVQLISKYLLIAGSFICVFRSVFV